VTATNTLRWVIAGCTVAWLLHGCTAERGRAPGTTSPAATTKPQSQGSDPGIQTPPGSASSQPPNAATYGHASSEASSNAAAPSPAGPEAAPPPRTDGEQAGSGPAQALVADAGVTNAQRSADHPDCSALREQLEALLVPAQVCDISLGRAPCTGRTEDLCGCPLVIDNVDMPAGKAYLGAHRAAVQACGGACPTVRCRGLGEVRCETTGGAALGTCSAQ